MIGRVVFRLALIVGDVDPDDLRRRRSRRGGDGPLRGRAHRRAPVTTCIIIRLDCLVWDSSASRMVEPV